VLVENFRPGVLERLGLGWETLRVANPGLVMLSISGFGQTGPQSSRPGFGKIAEGLSGVVSLTGEAGKPPLYVGFSLADASAGLFGVHGVAVALYCRDVLGGSGARIDLALYEPLMRMLDCQLALHARDGVPPERGGTNDPYGFGRASESRPRFRSVESASGRWYLLAVAEAQAEAADLLIARASTLDDAALEDALFAAGIEFCPVFDGMTIASSPYFQARGDVISQNHPVVGPISAPGPLHGGAAPAFHPPALGEANAEIFGGLLGLTGPERARLKADGVI
jgi:crotonobetainyl-CoA:carnitine CoA-transferase CaiB-like acyl-CoA transferase